MAVEIGSRRPWSPGCSAITVHNLVDFGLETLGVLLPFMAVLGTVLGRLRPPNDAAPFWRGWPSRAIACGGLFVGTVPVAHPSYDDFDALLKKPSSRDQRRQLLERAQRAHPTDYFYALALARLEPIRASTGGPSPRFHALNRALVLCPSCEQVHVEVARNLWSLGLRRQSLLEWRTAVSLQPALLTPTLGGARTGRQPRISPRWRRSTQHG